MGYPGALATHLALVTLSISLFGLRFILMMAGSPGLRQRALQILPHVVDTALLGSGVWLMWLTRQYPLVNAWLTVKLLAVVAYIVLGSVALKYGRTRRWRIAAGAAALLTLGWIVLVALTHNPLGPFAGGN